MAADEFALIEALLADEPTWPDWLTLPPGDDAAGMQVPVGHELLLSTDTLVAGRHFPDQLPPDLLGWRALAVNLSDLAAMGARPAGFLVALVSPALDVDWCRRFSAGLRAAAGDSGARVIGGNLARGPLAVSITVTGWAPVGTALRRGGARPGDQLCVSGTIGGAGVALESLLGDIPPDLARFSLEQVPASLRPYLLPTARVALGQRLRGQATACIDISDGLLADLRHVLRASGVGAVLHQERMPVAAGADPERALVAGDDYELLFTLPAAVDAQALAEQVEVPVRVVGEIRAEPDLVLMDHGQRRQLPAGLGWSHF